MEGTAKTSRYSGCVQERVCQALCLRAGKRIGIYLAMLVILVSQVLVHCATASTASTALNPLLVTSEPVSDRTVVFLGRSASPRARHRQSHALRPSSARGRGPFGDV